MKTWAWRILLSAANVLMAAATSPQVFHGAFAYNPGFYFHVNSLDLVPRALVNLTFVHQMNHHLFWPKGYWIQSVFWEYLLLVFLFWWWVGSNIDRRISLRRSGPTWTWVEFTLALGLSLMLFFESRTGHSQAFGLISIAWGIVLMGYSLLQLFRGIAILRSPAVTT
jgi:hypothetical protein